MFVRNIYTRIASSILTTAIGFVPFILIVRVFGKEVVGNIAYYYSIAGIVSIFADLGLSTAYNKFLASEDNPKDIVTYLFLKAILIAVYIVTFFLVYQFKFKNDTVDSTLIVIAFFVVLSDLLAQFFTCTLRGKRDFVILSKIEIASSIALCLYNLIVCFYFVNKYFLAANMIIYQFVIICGGIFYFYHKRLNCFGIPQWSEVRKYVNFAWLIAFSSIASRIIANVDKLLLGKFIGFGELGLYQIALRCYSMIDRLIKPVTSTMFTEIVHRITNTPLFFEKKFRSLIHLLNFSGGILVLLLFFLSKDVVTLFFGTENIRGSFILKFFSLVILARLFWRPYNHVVYALEKHKLLLYFGPFDMLFRVACYYYLIPLQIGDFYLGAAALPLTEFILWLFPIGLLRVWILKRKYEKLHMIEVAVKVWLPLSVIIAFGILIGRPILGLIIALPVFYVVEYYLGIITGDKLKILLEPIRRSYFNTK